MERTDPDMVVLVALVLLLLNIQTNRLVRRLGRIVIKKNYFSAAPPSLVPATERWIPQPDMLEVDLSFWPGAEDSGVSTKETQAMAKESINSVYMYMQKTIKSNPSLVSVIVTGTYSETNNYKLIYDLAESYELESYTQSKTK